MHGACVNRPNDIASQLALKTHNAVLNLSQRGNGPLIEYATVKEYVSKEVDVKNLIWFFTEENDLKELENSLSNKFLIKYLKNNNYSQNLIKKQKKIDEMHKFTLNNQIKEIKDMNSLQAFKKQSLINFVKLYNTRNSVIKIKTSEKKINLKIKVDNQSLNSFIDILNKMIEFTNDNDINFYFVYMPTYQSFKDEKYNEDIYTRIIEIVKNMNITYIDIFVELKKNQNPLQFFPFEEIGHFNKEGYAYIANFVYDSIILLETLSINILLFKLNINNLKFFLL